MNAAMSFHPLHDHQVLDALLREWQMHGWLRPIDGAFARFLRQQAPHADPLLILAAALASHQLGRGHACLDIAHTLREPAAVLSLPPEAGDGEQPLLPETLLSGLTLTRWREALECDGLVAPGAGATPLVLEQDRLYLRRYWQYEQAVRRAIDARLAQPMPAAVSAKLRYTLDVLFPGPAAGDIDWQRVACALAARSAFSIITGGPGTGKTTTVVRLLALLQVLAHEQGAGHGLRIRLAAPTGKAAARLAESIADARDSLPFDCFTHGQAVREQLPLQVTTLHRLLGSRPDTRRFRFGADHPLSLDVLVVDEASMIDLEMLAAVMAALPAHARLVLLGDKDQLASVEAGAVFGALCARAEAGHYTPETRDWLHAQAGVTLPEAHVGVGGTRLDQSLCMLRHSHRFAAEGGIGQLAAAVNAGAHAKALRLLDEGGGVSGLQHLHLRGPEDGALARLVRGDETADGFAPYLEVLHRHRPALHAPHDVFDDWARDVLAAHRRFQVLCAVRRGPFGVDGLNDRIARWLQQAGHIDAAEGWYAGRPVLVTRNDHALGLMNGDVGVALPLPAARAGETPYWQLRVVFVAGDGSGRLRWLVPGRLPEIETVFAMTVHKSQGSEFEHVALVLPERSNPGLTRELVYTGLTRASERLTLVTSGTGQVFSEAITRRTVNASGLMHAG